MSATPRMYVGTVLIMIIWCALSVHGHPSIRINARRSMYTFGTKPEMSKASVVLTAPFARTMKPTGDSTAALKSIAVAVSVGSPYLDYSLILKLPGTATVGELKQRLNQQYPERYPSFQGDGSGRAAYPALYCDSVLLEEDSETLDAVWQSGEPMPLTLGLLFATPSAAVDGVAAPEVGLRAISDDLAAHLALAVKKAYISNKLLQAAGSGSPSIGAPESSSAYGELLRTLNSSLYALHGGDIAAAVARERDPEALGGVDAATVERERDYALSTLPVLRSALSRFTTINSFEALQQQLYWSGMLWLFANYGTSSELSKNILLGSIGVLWVSTLRSFRFLQKLFGSTVLPWLNAVLPLSPLLSGASQTVLSNLRARVVGDGIAGGGGDTDLSRLPAPRPASDDLESFFEYR